MDKPLVNSLRKQFAADMEADSKPNKTCAVRVRLTPLQMWSLMKAASKQGRTVADVVRRAIARLK